MKLNELLESMAGKVKKQVKYYTDDFHVYDTDYIKNKMHDGLYLWFTRPCGTWLWELIPSEYDMIYHIITNYNPATLHFYTIQKSGDEYTMTARKKSTVEKMLVAEV